MVGIGEDGWDGLGEPARAALRGAALIVGSARQLALLPELGVRCAPLPAPLLERLDGLVRDHRGLCLLASGDPMLHGIGATLARRLPPGALRVLPAVSSVALACARLGWPEQEAEVVSLVSQPPEAVLAALAPGARLIVLARDGGTPAAVAARLAEAGWGNSELTVLERLGGPAERVIGPLPARRLAAGADRGPRVPGESAGPDGLPGSGGTTRGAGTAAADAMAGGAAERFADLCVLAVRAHADAATGAGPAAAGGQGGSRGRALASGRLPGLPDEAFETDGQITRRELRVLALAALRPGPGELLWDVGAGSGSIGVEWLRAQPLARAIAVEARPDRAQRAGRNAAALGVPGLRVTCGHAPDVLAGLPAPDAVFIGGGVTTPGVLEACWERLRPGGRLVAHAVTVESGAVLHAWQQRPRRPAHPVRHQLPGAARLVHHLAPGPAGHPVERHPRPGGTAAGARSPGARSRGARRRAARRAGGAPVTVYFVGAGPGAADLLTVRALRLIEAAPVILYAGSLVPAEVLTSARADARLVDTADLDLAAIIAELVAADRAGLDVVRLHSGDPSIFSAIAEQARRLDAAGVAWTVVPGVPAFAAAAAALGQELTLPGVGQTVVLTRTAARATPMPPGEELAALGATGCTLVLHLAVQNIDQVSRELLPHYGAGCPAAVVARASWPDEVVLRCALGDLAGQVRAAGIRRTAVIVIGRVLAGGPFRDSHLYSAERDRAKDKRSCEESQ